MNKKSGSAGSRVSPIQPIEAHAADLADPGEMAKIKAQERQSQTGKYGSTPAKTYQPPGPEDSNAEETERHWLEIELVDQDGNPVAGEAYHIVLPDGETVADGTLDEKGFARLDGLEAGSCEVSFPNLDKLSWKPA